MQVSFVGKVVVVTLHNGDILMGRCVADLDDGCILLDNFLCMLISKRENGKVQMGFTKYIYHECVGPIKVKPSVIFEATRRLIDVYEDIYEQTKEMSFMEVLNKGKEKKKEEKETKDSK